MKLGWPTTRTMFRSGGLIRRTVGGSETLLNWILGSPPHPAAPIAASSQSAGRGLPGGRREIMDQKARRIGGLRERGGCSWANVYGGGMLRSVEGGHRGMSVHRVIDAPARGGLAGEDQRIIVRALRVVRVDRRRAGHPAADDHREEGRQDQQG